MTIILYRVFSTLHHVIDLTENILRKYPTVLCFCFPIFSE